MHSGRKKRARQSKPVLWQNGARLSGNLARGPAIKPPGKRRGGKVFHDWQLLGEGDGGRKQILSLLIARKRGEYIRTFRGLFPRCQELLMEITTTIPPKSDKNNPREEYGSGMSSREERLLRETLEEIGGRCKSAAARAQKDHKNPELGRGER